MIYPLKNVIFHGYVNVYQRLSIWIPGLTHSPSTRLSVDEIPAGFNPKKSSNPRVLSFLNPKLMDYKSFLSYPLVNVNEKLWKITMLFMGKSTISIRFLRLNHHSQ